MQSIASRLSILCLLLAWHSIRAVLDTLPMHRTSVDCYFSVCEAGLFATEEGAVCTARLQIVVYCVTHGELSNSCLCPVDKSINSCFSCLAVLFVCRKRTMSTHPKWGYPFTFQALYRKGDVKTLTGNLVVCLFGAMAFLSVLTTP